MIKVTIHNNDFYLLLITFVESLAEKKHYFYDVEKELRGSERYKDIFEFEKEDCMTFKHIVDMLRTRAEYVLDYISRDNRIKNDSDEEEVKQANFILNRYEMVYSLKGKEKIKYLKDYFTYYIKNYINEFDGNKYDEQTINWIIKDLRITLPAIFREDDENRASFYLINGYVTFCQ